MKSLDEKCHNVQHICNRLYQETETSAIQLLLNDLKDGINQLKEISSQEKHKKHLIQGLQLPLLVPLIVHIRKPSKTDLKCIIIDCIRHALLVTSVKDLNIFFEIYTVIFFQIYNVEQGCLNRQLSEEIKLEVFKCAVQLLRSTEENVLLNLYNKESAKKISLGILLTVQIAQEEKNFKLRLESLKYLLVVSQYFNKDNVALQKKVADTFMLFLPGILGCLQEILSRDETQHHLVAVTALTCWGHVISLVMCDQEEPPISDDMIVHSWLNISETNEAAALNTTEALKQNERNKEWLQAAATILKPLILKTTNVKNHSNPKVKLELTKVMTNLLETCIINLESSLTSIIEVLVTFTEDEDEEIQKAAESALSSFEIKRYQRHGKLFIDVIEENLHTLVNKMPGIIHSGNDKIILSALKLMSGYLKIFGLNSRLVTFHLKKLITVVTMASELESYSEIAEQEFSIWDREGCNFDKTWKRFKHFTDQSISKKLEEICRLLCNCGGVETVIDYFTEELSQNPTKETLFVVNAAILGSDLQDNLVRHLLNVYLDPRNLYLPLEVDNDDCLSVKEAHANIMTVALVMEGIGSIAVVIGKRMEEYLLRSLYFVMERIGSSFRIIRTSATTAGMQISTACGLDGSVSALIQANVDYLTYHLTVKLKRAASNSCVFDVVIVLMKNSPMEAMSNLEEIVNNVLVSSIERFESPYTKSYLRLFQTFVLCVNKWLHPEIKERKPEDKNKDDNFDSLISYIESKNQKEEAAEDVEENMGQNENEADEAEATAKEKKKLPVHITMTLSIARHCLNFLPSRDRDKKLMVLEILHNSIVILSEWEDELLPLVHEIWSPLVTRFDRVVDPLIISRSFMLLCTLSKASGDFIRSRTLKEVLPTLRFFLLKTAGKSRKKDSGSGYYFTQEFKLQRELLGQLGQLTTELKLFEKQADCVVECSLPYLSSLQPQPLQERCLQLFLHLLTYDPFLVWFRLQRLEREPEFSKNVEKVMQACLSL